MTCRAAFAYQSRRVWVFHYHKSGRETSWLIEDTQRKTEEYTGEIFFQLGTRRTMSLIEGVTCPTKQFLLAGVAFSVSQAILEITQHKSPARVMNGKGCRHKDFIHPRGLINLQIAFHESRVNKISTTKTTTTEIITRLYPILQFSKNTTLVYWHNNQQ